MPDIGNDLLGKNIASTKKILTLAKPTNTITQYFDGIEVVTPKIKHFNTAFKDLKTNVENAQGLGNKIGALFGIGSISSKQMKVETDSFNSIISAVKNVDLEGLVGADASKRIAEIVDGLGDATVASKQFAKANIEVNSAGQLVIPTQQQFEKALQKSSAAMSVATIKAQALAIAENALTSLVLGFAIGAITKGIDSLIHYNENLHQTAVDLANEYQELADEAASLQEQIDSNNESIEELKNQGPLSITDQNDLNRLTAENEQLKVQLELQQQLAEQAKNESVESALKDYNSSTHWATGMGANADFGFYTRTDIITDRVQKAEQYREKLQELRAEYAAYLKAVENGEDTSGFMSASQYEKAIETYETKMNDFYNDALTLQGELEDLRPSLMSDPEANKEIIDSIDQTAKALNDFAFGVEQIDEDAFNEIFDAEKYEDVQTKLIALARQGKLTAETFADPAYSEFANDLGAAGISAESAASHLNSLYSTAGRLATITESLDSVKSSFENISSAIDQTTSLLSEQSTGVGISIDAYESLIALNSDYANALEYTNGTMQINYEKAQQITKVALDQAVKKATVAMRENSLEYERNVAAIAEKKSALAELTDEQDDLRESLTAEINALQSENEALLENANGYAVIISKMKEATSAYSEWQNAQSASDPGDMFGDVAEARDFIDESLNTGRVGNEKFEAAVDFIIPDTVDKEDEAAIRQYLNSLDRYITRDEDGNRTFEGMHNFIQDATGLGLMESLGDGQYKIAEGIDTEDFVNQMGITLDTIRAIFGELESFGWKFDWLDEMAQAFAMDDTVIQDVIQDIQNEITSLNNSPIALEVDNTEIVNLYSELYDVKHMKDGLSEVTSVNVKAHLEALDQLDAAEAKMEALKTSGEATDVEIANQQVLIDQLKANLEAMPKVTESEIRLSTSEAEAQLAEWQAKRDAVVSGNEDVIETLSIQLNTDNVSDILQYVNDQIASIRGEQTQIQILGDSSDYTQKSDNVKNDEIDPKTVDVKANTTEWDRAYTNIQNAKFSAKTIDVGFNYTGISFGKSSSSSSGSKKGTGGTATASGSPGIPSDRLALVGELGREIVVDPSTGTWRTVGNNGAEFVHLKKGSIVFSNQQTERLLGSGKAGSRGMALALGYGGDRWVTGNPGASSGSSNTSTSTLNRQLDILEQQKTVLEQQKEAIEAQNDALNDQKDLYDSVIAAVTDLIDDEIERLKEMYEDQKELLEDQKDDMDAALSAVINIIDTEIEKLEDAQDALDDAYQPRIDAIQDEIDALEKRNQAEKENLDLNQKKAALDRANSQRTIRIYREGYGFTWQTDQSAIDDAQQDYNDALYDKQVSDLKSEKEELEEALEAEKEKLQESIDSYQEYEQKWQEITDLYEQAQNKQILNMLFGKDFEIDIINQKDEAYTLFRDKYLAIQEQLTNVEKEIEANNIRIEELEKIKAEWESVATAYEEQQNRLNAAMVLGQNWEADILAGRTTTLNTFRDNYINVMSQIAAKAQEMAALEEQIRATTANIEALSARAQAAAASAASAAAAASASSTSAVAAANKASSATIPYTSPYKNPTGTIIAMGSYASGKKYASGTTSSPRTFATIDEVGEELVVRPSRGRNVFLEKGSGVIPADVTKTLWEMGLDPQGFFAENFSDMMRSGMAAVSNVGRAITMSFGDIMMNGVNNPESFARVLVSKLPTVMVQALRKG